MRTVRIALGSALFRSLPLGLLFAFLVACSSRAAPRDAGLLPSGRDEDPAAITIDGVIEPDDRYDYVMRAFDVPEGVERIEVDFDYDQSGKTELEIGLVGPDRFRGTSRFSKDQFFVATYTATPSYYPGPIPAGTWQVSIGVPTIYEPTAYSVSIRLYQKSEAGGTGSGPQRDLVQTGWDWYQGDFHSHTGHSDGYGCQNESGERVPCQVHENVDIADSKNLDFVAITDHNTTSHHNEMAALQQRYDDMLLLRGQEITTFYGHANAYGTSRPIGFMISKEELFDSIAEEVNALNALLSLNHPGRETGDACTGCGWSMPGTDYGEVDAIEVVNGTDIDGPTSGKQFWYDRLNEGHRITAIGGSDDHGASADVIGTPTTVVYANGLSEEALLDAVKKGHVFIKTRGPGGPSVVLSAKDEEGTEYTMGEEITAAPGTSIRLDITVEGCPDGRIVMIKNGEATKLLAESEPGDGDRLSVTVEAGAGRDWYLVQILDGEGTVALTNPVYVDGQ